MTEIIPLITDIQNQNYPLTTLDNTANQNCVANTKQEHRMRVPPVSILRKSISGRHRPVRVADGPMTARCRFT